MNEPKTIPRERIRREIISAVHDIKWARDEEARATFVLRALLGYRREHFSSSTPNQQEATR